MSTRTKSLADLLRLVEEVGAVCMADGLKVVVATLGATEQEPVNPEGVVPEDSNWEPADQIPTVNMNPINDKVFVNSSEEEDRETMRSAAYLLAAFGGLDNAREYLSQVSESLGHVPPRMPEDRPKWVVLTREQFAADLEEMFRQALEPKPVNPEGVVPEDSNWEPVK
jgi:hypothetical protein